MDVAPEVRWLSEDKYKNLKVVVEIDEAVDAEKAAEKELTRRHKALGLLRIVADRGLQVICYSYLMVPLVSITDVAIRYIIFISKQITSLENYVNSCFVLVFFCVYAIFLCPLSLLWPLLHWICV